jgi:hypothetical protein
MSRLFEQVLGEYLWILVVAVSGGLAHYSQQVWVAKTRKFSGVELAVELFTAGFSGVIMFLLCQVTEIPAMGQAAAVGIAGHMGTRFLYGLHGTVCAYLKCHKKNGDANDNQGGD